MQESSSHHSRFTSRRRPEKTVTPSSSVKPALRTKAIPSQVEALPRLQKVLASAGLGSRRNCETLITTGRVEVDRRVITELGTRVDPHKQEVRIDGERLPDPKRVVYMLHKPVGVVTTNFDPSGRPRVFDLVPVDHRLFAIGRLDRMSEGLILLTNDGDLANHLAHPRYGVEKRYMVQVAGVPTPEILDRLRRGIDLAEGVAHARRVDLRSSHKLSSVLEMVLDEGKNREIRRMLAHLGHKVHQLKRVAVGSLSLGSLLPGQWRPLTWQEIESLRASSGPVDSKLAQRSSRPQVVRRPRENRGTTRPFTRETTSSGRTPSPRTGTGRSSQRRVSKKPGKASSWRKPRSTS